MLRMRISKLEIIFVAKSVSRDIFIFLISHKMLEFKRHVFIYMEIIQALFADENIACCAL